MTVVIAPRGDGDLDGLAALLADAVDGGASLNFVHPFTAAQARAWWQRQRDETWVARDGDGIAGTVTLIREHKPNGRHRGEIVKLIVHRRARGHGLGRRLLDTAERAAAAHGLTLLLLDTETGSAADHLYRAAGWTCYGVVPGYAADPHGTPRDCSFFYREL
jgi:ribosomal protein S18 acetylase RimI-like enzyme